MNQQNRWVIFIHVMDGRCFLVSIGDFFVGLPYKDSGVILVARVGKHTDSFIEELVNSTEGKTACSTWHTDGWSRYERVLAAHVHHQIGKKYTQRLEWEGGILRQQTGQWHRRQNKFAQVWEQTEVTTRLVVSYFNWIWVL